MSTNELFKRKSVQIASWIFSVLLGAYGTYGFVSLVRQTHTRALEQEFAAAVEQLQKSPPGIERVETYVRALKKIDPGHAPAEVKAALRDYIAALQQSLEALKAGRDTADYEPRIAEAKQRLIACVKKCD